MTQPSFPVQVLPQRAVLSVEGDEAPQFLQSLVTADVLALAEAEAAYGALLTPQGKIHVDFFIIRSIDGFLIDCAAARRAGLIEKLGLYKLRSRVHIAPREEVEVGVGPGGGGQPICYRDPRLPQLGDRYVVPKGTLPHATGYEAWRMQLGIAGSEADIGQDKLFPHEANFDLLNGISFTKGCYVGQEVVSRTQHRGTPRSRILPVSFEGSPPADGSEILAGERPAGLLLSTLQQQGLALMRLDRLPRPGEALLTAGVRTLVHIPFWMKDKVTFGSAST
jgi:folate-binding protein YgfZ